MVHDKSPTRTARRDAKRRRRLPENPICPTCLERDPVALELHHVMGQAHDNITIVQCKNCHAKATEGQRLEEVPLESRKDFLDHLAAMLEALAAFFAHLADALRAIARKVRDFARGLIRPSQRRKPC